MEPRPSHRPTVRRPRTVATLFVAAAMLATAAPTAATHTHGTLDCGAEGTYQVEPASEVDPLPFEAPGPGAGVFLLEDGTTVFKAFSIVAPHFAYERAASSRGLELVSCTLTSSGPMFPEPWLLEGRFLP